MCPPRGPDDQDLLDELRPPSRKVPFDPESQEVSQRLKAILVYALVGKLLSIVRWVDGWETPLALRDHPDLEAGS
jgi:hypothetical protein